MVDRNDGYIPRPTYDGGTIKPTFTTLIGDPRGGGGVRDMPVALGSADEYNDKQTWWWAQANDGADGKEHWSHFDGWMVRVGVDLRTWNRREVNDWKGRDEIRKEGQWRITFNEKVVYGGYVNRDVLESLLTIRRTIQQLESLPIDWRQDDYVQQIEGRKVYYKTTPATLYHWMPDQGCVMVRALPGTKFPRSPYDIDRDPESPEHDYSEEYSTETKIELLSPDIWWYRDRG